MEKKPYFCIICGRQFWPQNAGAKYCSAGCRAAGAKTRRRTWEARTGYAEKKRIHEQERRNRIKAEANAERDAAAEVKSQEKKKRDAIRRQQRENTIRKAAVGGDALARMALAAMQSGTNSEEYWTAYRDYDREFAASWGEISETTVNGISVQEPDFPRQVCEEAKKGNRIVEQVHHIRPPQQESQKK